MRTVYYIHWHEQELEERIKPLVDAGYEVRSHWSMVEHAKWDRFVPDVVVISLARLPSHGRKYAAWLWESKKRQHIPIIFVDGKPQKVDATRERFPKALFCQREDLIRTIETCAKKAATEK